MEFHCSFCQLPYAGLLGSQRIAVFPSLPLRGLPNKDLQEGRAYLHQAPRTDSFMSLLKDFLVLSFGGKAEYGTP